MKPADILSAMRADGLVVVLHDDAIKLAGPAEIVARWRKAVRDNKTALIELQKVGAGYTATDPMTPADARMEKVIDQLRGDPGLRYAIEAHDDVELESVILTLAIRDKVACELRIPKSRYDGFALLELIEKHTTKATVQ